MDAKTEPAEAVTASNAAPVAADGSSPEAASPPVADSPHPSSAIHLAPTAAETQPTAATPPASQKNGVAVKSEDAVVKARAAPATAAQPAKAEESQNVAKTPPPQQKGSNTGASVPVAASAVTSQLVSLDAGEVRMKLERLFNSWEGNGLNAATPTWADVDALCVFVGRAADEDDSAAERIQSWLTGFQFLETLFVFVRSSKAWLVLTSAKKAEHLRQLETIKGLQIFVKDPQEGNRQNLVQMATAMRTAIGKDVDVSRWRQKDVRIAPFLGGSVSETPGTMAAEVVPWLKNFTHVQGNIETPLSPLIVTLAPSEVALVSDASRVSVAMVKYQLVSRVEFVLDNGQKESHKSICDRAELLLKDQKQLQKLKEKCNLDPTEVEVLFKNVQSGSRFDLRASAQPSSDSLSQSEGTIVVSLGCKYKDFCAALCRTFILNGRKEQKDTYELALELQQHVMQSLKPGVSFSSIYEKAVEFLNTKKPSLLKHLAKSVGHAIGAQYRDTRLVFNQKNDKVFIEPGMAFLVSVAFSDLRTGGGNEYAVWIADTVYLKPDGTVQVLTDGLSSQLAYVNYELDEGEEEQKPSPASKSKSSKDDRRDKKGDENVDGNTAEKKKGKDKGKKDRDTEKSDKQSTGTISASVLKNAESLILRDRLRRRDNGSAAHMDAAEERDNRQRELRKKKLNALQQRFAREDAEDGGDEQQQRRQKKMQDLRAFNSPEEFPKDLRPSKLYVDMKSECLFVPFPGHHLPFHLSTVKNVTCSESESNLNAARVAAGGRPSRFSILRINFQVPGSQTLTQKGEENPLPDIAGKNQLFVKELMFKSEDSRHLQTIYRTIKEQLKRVKQKAAEDLQYPGELAAQEKLILNRSGRRILLKDLMVRPNISTGMRKLIGALEAHTNGLRFTVNTRGQMDVVDITYSNIKHAILQPCERELIVLVHFHLKAPILVGKKRTQDVQFYTEAGTQTDDLDNRRNRSYHDPDETLDEMREREMKKRLNGEFKRFVQQVEEVSKVEFDLPYRELKFSGVPLKSNVEILPTANCLVHLVEWPPFVLPLEDIEIVSFERVAHGLRNFDMVFVFQDYSKPVKRIDLIPIEYLDNLKRWLNELEIVWYEGKQNLNWSAILKEIRDDPRGFVEDGGFDMFLGDANGSEEEGEESEDDDDEEYAEQSSSDDDKEYKEDGSDAESSGQESESESDYSSEDSSLADESDDEEAAGTDSDEEEGLSWDELEERAKKEDRKRQHDGDSEGEETRTKKKRK